MSLDRYFERRYDRQRYNCLAFTADVWADLTGQDIRSKLAGLLGATADRRVARGHVEAFTRLSTPAYPCLVLMQRPRSTPHIGVFIRGKLLHILERGVEYQPLDVASLTFTSVRFYSCRP